MQEKHSVQAWVMFLASSEDNFFLSAATQVVIVYLLALNKAQAGGGGGCFKTRADLVCVGQSAKFSFEHKPF